MSSFKNIFFKLADPLGLVLKPDAQAPAAPEAPPATPERTDPAVDAAAQAEAVRNRRLRGRGATLLYGAAEPDPTGLRQSGATLLGQ